MYDSIHLVGAMAELVVCAHGHSQRGELQTKDLECEMIELYVHDGRLFAGARRHEDERETREFGMAADTLVMTSRRHLAPRAHHGAVVAYTHCEECDPIVYERDTDFCGRVDTVHPWVEWELVFDGGALVRVTRIAAETRDELRAKTVGALPDDDRVARRAIQQHRDERK
jgi:hypothetical protein